MLKATAIVAGSLLLGTASFAVAESQQLTQAQMQNQQTQNRSQLEQDYQNRLNAARTPEERARIQAEWDRSRQQGAVPGIGSNSDPAAPSNRSVPGGPGQSEQFNYPNQPNQGDQGKGG